MKTFSFDEIRYEDRTLPAVWRKRVASNTSAGFLWYRGLGAAIDIGTVDARIRAVRRSIKELAKKGDRVCLLMRTSPEMLVVMLALWEESIVVVPFNPELQGASLRQQLERAAPRLLLVDSDLADTALSDSAGILDRSDIVIGRQRPDGGYPPSFQRIDLTAKVDAADLDQVATDPRDPALILFTSGSTGPSKGCVLSHQTSVYYGWVFARHMGYREDDRIYTCLPLNHVHALFASFIAAIIAGARFAFAERFSASQYWKDISESGATTCSAIGPMASILIGSEPSEWERSATIRLAHIAPAPPFAAAFEQRFRLKIASALYGLTEAMVIAPDPEREPVPGLLGKPTADWEIEIHDDRGNTLPPGEIGELVARPRRAGIIFDEYFGQPAETLKTFKELWFHTGDQCKIDDAGDFWFIGRLKDIIRRRGENVSAWQIEVAATGLADVQEVAAVPVESEMGDEHIALVVMRRPGSTLQPGTVEEYCARTLPRFMRPDVIRIQDVELPRTASGKIDKPTLRAAMARS